MAAKKKSAPKKKKATRPSRRPARKSSKPAAVAPQATVSVEPEARVSGLGKFIVVLALALLVMVLYMALRKSSQPAAAPAPEAAPAAAPAAAAPAAPAEAPAPVTAPKISTAKPGEDPTGLTLKTGASMTLRCWRKNDDQASLDVFGPHNKPVAHLNSETGKAGWAHLTWKAQDDNGQNLAPGVYYLRPSTSGAQKLVEVTLEP
jgi:hypothetical protein